MQMLGLGTKLARARSAALVSHGFTLLELLVVVAIMALATAGVGFALRDGAAGDLEREAQRLAALLESARAQSRMSGNPVHWHTTPGGFVFEGLPGTNLPDRWLYQDTRVITESPRQLAALNLGPEPLIGPQNLVLTTISHPERSLSISTDGVRPFNVAALGAISPSAP